MAATIAGAHQLVLELVASAAVVAAAKIRAITLPLLLSLAHRHLRRAVRLFGPEPLARLAAPSLTEQMGGSVTLDATAAKGARFIVELPLSTGPNEEPMQLPSNVATRDR